MIINKNLKQTIEDTSQTLIDTVKSQNPLAIMTVLKRKDIDINQVDEDNNTALMWAARYDSQAPAALLLNQKADVNKENNEKYTALMFAAASDSEDTTILRWLLREKPDLDKQNINGETALLLAVIKEFKNKVQLLLEAGASPNLADENGDTPLIWAARQGKLEIAQLLVQNHADINAFNQKKETAVDWAEKRNCPKISELLENDPTYQKRVFNYENGPVGTDKDSINNYQNETKAAQIKQPTLK